MAKMQKPEQLVMIFTIIERGCGNKLTKLYTKNQVFTHMRCEGTGTATSEIMDILGLGSSEKDIIMSLAPMSAARALLDRLEDDLHSAAPGRGIAFTVPLAAVNSLVATVITMRTKVDWEDGGEMDKEKKSSLVLVMLNQGYTDAVMETAKKAGARGGTIIRGRWVADDGMDQQFQGVGQQAEKEILYIVVPREIRNGVMEAINTKHGVQTEAGALVCALGIDQMVHLG